MTVPALRLVDANGELVEPDACPRCAGVEIGEVERLERRVTILERDKEKLKREKDKERERDPRRVQIEEVFDYWVERVRGGKRTVKLSADRHDAIRSRLKESYSVEDMKLAVDCVAAFPYLVYGERREHGTTRKDDITDFLGGGAVLEKSANLGHRARKQAA